MLLHRSPRTRIHRFPDWSRGDESAAESGRRLRVMSFNIQAGTASRGYHHYLVHGWKHLLPFGQRMANLGAIARLLSRFDLVGLQEVDAGSLRSGFVNQIEYLAQYADHPFWHIQVNRNLGRLGQFSNGLLSRFRPSLITDLSLPGLIPGRGAMLARYGDSSEQELVVVVLHLALGKRARMRQMDCICEHIQGAEHVLMMGDWNCHEADLGQRLQRCGVDLHEPTEGLNTFPSWAPQRSLDRILISRSLEVHRVQALPNQLSDHLPVAIELTLPAQVRLSFAGATQRNHSLAG